MQQSEVGGQVHRALGRNVRRGGPLGPGRGLPLCASLVAGVARADDAPPPAPAPACDPAAELELVKTIVSGAEGTLSIYLGKNVCDVDDPSGIDAVKSEFNALQGALGHADCARRSNDPKVRAAGVAASEAVRQLSRKLSLLGAHMLTQQALFDAEKALADAKKAKNLDDAKASAKVAAEQAKAARAALQIASDSCTRSK